ncbi:hypothetical protein PBI_ANJALI_27 [Arthrobacter phage Anjali]|uniref:Uncharacterized protein n=1 Tax=Arthrobacter phage Anjali TaxID=2484217 RepID=A0A3G3LY13_9CAUD|nr:hypothetical protein HWB95_gp27 [Arthrobacter phage Anjali]AYQ98997.1 hypothetical protein PBI_ANJALI_27 [Arthrobacter phage Anjali]
MKLSDRQQAFLKEANHLGIETSIVELPGEVILLLKEPTEYAPNEIAIRAVPGAPGRHINSARFYTYHRKGHDINLKDAGYTMLEWAGR